MSQSTFRRGCMLGSLLVGGGNGSLVSSNRDTDRSGSTRCTRVAAEAGRCLRASPYMIVRKMSCEYREGVLLLRGRVASYYHKQVAQEAVARLEGVVEVVNEIEVGDREVWPIP